MRTVGIWVSGLLASVLIGGGIGSYFFLSPEPGETFGAIAGVLGFTCARLWLAWANRRASVLGS